MCVCVLVCVCVCLCVCLCSQLMRRGHQSRLASCGPAQGRTSGHRAAARWVSWSRHRTVCLNRYTHTCTHTHSIPLLGTKGHHVIEVVSELRGWRDGRDTQTQTHTQQSFSSALTGSALNTTIYTNVKDKNN